MCIHQSKESDIFSESKVLWLLINFVFGTKKGISAFLHETVLRRNEGGISRSEEDMFYGRFVSLHHVIRTEGRFRRKRSLRIYCAFYQLFHVASVAQNKKIWYEKKWFKPVSIHFKLTNLKCNFHAVFPCACVCVWERETVKGAPRQNLLSGASQQTLRASVSQPDLCQTKVRVRGEFCVILWFRGKWNKKKLSKFFLPLLQKLHPTSLISSSPLLPSFRWPHTMWPPLQLTLWGF